MKCVYPARVNTFFMKTDFQLKSRYDGLNLSAVVVEPDQHDPEAVVQIAHGLCGCKERYLPFMEYMADHGVACVACDHRGHGKSLKSSRDLGYMQGGYMALVEDMKQLTDWAAGHFNGAPIVLLGHSMGSLAARVYIRKYDWELAGLVLCGTPGYNGMARMAMLLTGFMCMFKEGRMKPAYLQEYASSRFNKKFASEGRLAWMCSDPVVRNEVVSNPSNDYSITVNMMHNLLSMMVNTHSQRGWMVLNPELPVTFLSGEDDPVMGGEEKLHDAARMMAGLGYNNVTAAIFSDMRHEILNEVDKELVWDDILNFVKDISSK